MKPFSAILTVMLAASLLFTGCSSSQTESSTPESSSSSQSSSEPGLLCGNSQPGPAGENCR